MPEPATPDDVRSRYIEQLSDASIVMIEAINHAAEAERKLKKVRQDRTAMGEVVSDAARTFRQMEADMEKETRNYVRLYQQFLDFQEGK